MTNEERVAIVTGGSRGLGEEIVLELARRGWSVASCSRTASHREGDLGTATGQLRILKRYGDVSDPGFASQFFDEVSDQFGVPSLLVNNAATLGVVATPLDIELDNVNSVLNTNLIGPMKFCREFIARSSNQSPRTIVNIGGGGIGGRRVESGALPYVISKAALYYFTEILANNISGSGVNVNMLAPGLLPTTFMESGREAALSIGAQDLVNEIDKRRSHNDHSVYQRVVDWIVCLTDQRFSHITGRLISAQWDSQEKFLALANDDDMFKLRRIDDELFAKKRD